MVETWIRPDGRCFVLVRDSSPADLARSLRPLADELEQDLYVVVDEAAAGQRRLFEDLGFVVNRREREYLIPTNLVITGLRGIDVPAGYEVVHADEIAEDRLRRLDDALRQDVPGTDGWRWDPDGFHEETFASPFFDAHTYLIAIERKSGDDAGLVRVWNNPSRPRLGLIGVLPQHRRHGLARGLLARVLGVLAERGKSEVSTEVDDRNIASVSLLEGLGARRVGGSIELVRTRN